MDLHYVWTTQNIFSVERYVVRYLFHWFGSLTNGFCSFFFSFVQIGGFAFLEDIVPSAEIADLYRKGPNVFCSFECFDQTILQPKSGFILFKSRLKLLAFYSPLVFLMFISFHR